MWHVSGKSYMKLLIVGTETGETRKFITSSENLKNFQAYEAVVSLVLLEYFQLLSLPLQLLLHLVDLSDGHLIV